VSEAKVAEQFSNRVRYRTWIPEVREHGFAHQELGGYFHPKLSLVERDQAETEGWILGMP
jgi:hypothetical protein